MRRRIVLAIPTWVMSTRCRDPADAELEGRPPGEQRLAHRRSPGSWIIAASTGQRAAPEARSALGKSSGRGGRDTARLSAKHSEQPGPPGSDISGLLAQAQASPAGRSRPAFLGRLEGQAQSPAVGIGHDGPPGRWWASRALAASADPYEYKPSDGCDFAASGLDWTTLTRTWFIHCTAATLAFYRAETLRVLTTPPRNTRYSAPR